MPVSGQAFVQGTLHVDRYLTSYSVNFVQDRKNFIAQRATSVIPVLKQTDLYVVYDRGYFWRDEVATRALGGRPVQTGYKLTSQTYNAAEYALEHTIDDRQRANADDPIRLDENATTLLTQKHMIKQDRVWAQKFFTTGLWTTEAGGIGSGSPGSNQFLQFDQNTSDPIGTVDQYKDVINEKTGFVPNTLVLGASVRRKLRTHPDIADRIKYTQTGIADEDVLAKLFEVDTVVCARSVYNSAAEGAANSFSYIVDQNSMWLGYIEPNPGLDSPTAIATFAWTGLLPGVTNTLGGVIQRGRDERAHSDFFQGRMAWDMQIVAQDLGVFFHAAVGTAPV